MLKTQWEETSLNEARTAEQRRNRNEWHDVDQDHWVSGPHDGGAVEGSNPSGDSNDWRDAEQVV